MSKKIFIIGGKTQARSLAESLNMKNYDVTVINNDERYCQRIAEIEGINVICGDGSRVDVLEDADINKCDVAIAMNDHDADNLVVCQLCKKIFFVKKTVALVGDANRTDLFYQVGVDSVICAISAITSILEQTTIAGELNHVIPVTEGRIRISEILVSENSEMVGKKLADINLPKEANIGCVIRDNETIIARGDTYIKANDTLLLLASAACEDKAVRIITGRK